MEQLNPYFNCDAYNGNNSVYVLEKTIRSIKSGGGGVPKCGALNSDKWKVTRHKKIEKIAGMEDK